MKNLVIAALTVLFSSQTLASDGEAIPTSQAQCLELSAQQIVTMFADGGYEYQIVRDEKGIPVTIKPVNEGDATFSLEAVLRYDDLEESIYASDYNNSSAYGVSQITANGCVEHAFGEAQDDGD